MREMTATQASRGFSELLDAVEHRGESFRIVRRGRTVALVVPPTTFGRAELAALLGDRAVDAAWSDDVARLRDLVRDP